MKKDLCQILRKIEENDTNYDIRYQLIIKAMYFAQECGYKVGFRIDDGWVVIVLHLPEGQVSWHTPLDSIEYDGHTPEEKYKRIDNFVIKELIHQHKKEL